MTIKSSNQILTASPHGPHPPNDEDKDFIIVWKYQNIISKYK